ncbi:MAG: glycine cleavage system protein H [Calditrichaeota bacterium]|nr:MAG: glycine cleavage system protein H [Calditrichota bacterium]
MFTIKEYEIRPELYYDPEEHFWLALQGSRARVGMDPLVQDSMGAFVVVQLDEAGKTVAKGEAFGTVEAEKYVGPLRAPVSGTIVAVNEALVENPRLANTDPYGAGWFVEMEISDAAKQTRALLTGETALRPWFEQEVKKYEDEGWLAEF